MSNRLNDLTNRIITIIDEGLPYRFKRIDYDDDFAAAHGLKLADIRSKSYVPCLGCGADVAQLILMGKFKGNKPNVFCSTKCRNNHAFFRLTKINADTNFHLLAVEIIKRGLDLELQARSTRIKLPTRLTALGVALETNTLLRAILKELQDGNRRIGTSL